jgi:hypothetical protein
LVRERWGLELLAQNSPLPLLLHLAYHFDFVGKTDFDFGLAFVVVAAGCAVVVVAADFVVFAAGVVADYIGVL